MRRLGIWVTSGVIALAAVGLLGLWTYRVGTVNNNLALSLEADRQRNFNEMAFHVEQIQALLGKGLVTGTTRQNMRYMGDVYHHARSAVANFTALPLPAQASATTGKFLQQTGDFAVSLMHNEAAGRELDERSRAELSRLRDESENLSAQLQTMMAQYNAGGFRWNPPIRFSWAGLVRGPAIPQKPTAGAQAPANMIPGGWDQVATTMEKLPVMVYDGPFSDHIAKRSPAVSGPPVTRDEAVHRMSTYLPNAATYRTVGVEDVNGSLPSFSFRLAPASTPATSAEYTTTVEVAKNGGFLGQLLNSRTTGKPAIDLAHATRLGTEYLVRVGYPGMDATYGQVLDGVATVAFAFRENGVLMYPDQIKLRVALDNGEILGVDARQYLMSHHPRSLASPKVTESEAADKLNAELTVKRHQMALIPDVAGTGEILTHEFLTTFGDEPYLVYINAETGHEEQVLQVIQTDGGTFAL